MPGSETSLLPNSLPLLLVLDGEIVCLDVDGRPQFKNLLFRRELADNACKRFSRPGNSPNTNPPFSLSQKNSAKLIPITPTFISDALF
jgi:hypothetical protein